MPNARPFRFLKSRPIVAALTVAALLIGLGLLRRGQPPRSLAAVAMAIAQVAVWAWFVFDMVRSIRCLDELERRIHADALAVAGAITLVVVAGWGFLEKAGVPSADWTVGIVPLLIGTWIAGVLILTRRYR